MGCGRGLDGRLDWGLGGLLRFGSGLGIVLDFILGFVLDFILGIAFGFVFGIGFWIGRVEMVVVGFDGGVDGVAPAVGAEGVALTCAEFAL